MNEADLHARHLWLVNQEEFRERMKTDPEFCDLKIAGWWVWGISQWIGSGWCSHPEWTGRTNAGRKRHGIQTLERPWRTRPQLSYDMGIHRNALPQKRPMVHGGHTGKGVHADHPGQASQFAAEHQQSLSRQIPNLGDDGCGVHRERIAATVTEKRPLLSGNGHGAGVHADRAAELLDYFAALAMRLRRVRVCCGDWTRVLGPSVTIKHGITGIFLDPPYDMRVVSSPESGRDGAAPTDGLYSAHDNDLSAAVRDWAVANGDNPQLRIALCGYEGEHTMPDTWECVAWKSQGGFGNQRSGSDYANADRERVWFSPGCLRGRQKTLF